MTAALREAMVASLRPWLYPEEGGHLYRERIATEQAERAADALLSDPLAALIAERDQAVADLAHARAAGAAYKRMRDQYAARVARFREVFSGGPDTAALREAMLETMHRREAGGAFDGCPACTERVDALLALPEVAALTAERDDLAGQVAAARELLGVLDAITVGRKPQALEDAMDRLRSALGDQP